MDPNVPKFDLQHSSVKICVKMYAAEVGCRVQIQKDRATVRYLGPVNGQEGSWVGVEWDDATRGKHDGTTGGTRYFACSSSEPTAGSFIREEKVDFGMSVLDAIISRYNNMRSEMGDAPEADELYVTTVSTAWGHHASRCHVQACKHASIHILAPPHAMPPCCPPRLSAGAQQEVQIQLVGEQLIRAQQSQIHKLTSARVVGACVSHAVSASDSCTHAHAGRQGPQMTQLSHLI